jgi:hypothetical protein
MVTMAAKAMVFSIPRISAMEGHGQRELRIKLEEHGKPRGKQQRA